MSLPACVIDTLRAAFPNASVQRSISSFEDKWEDWDGGSGVGEITFRIASHVVRAVPAEDVMARLTWSQSVMVPDIWTVGSVDYETFDAGEENDLIGWASWIRQTLVTEATASLLPLLSPESFLHPEKMGEAIHAAGILRCCEADVGKVAKDIVLRSKWEWQEGDSGLHACTFFRAVLGDRALIACRHVNGRAVSYGHTINLSNHNPVVVRKEIKNKVALDAEIDLQHLKIEALIAFLTDIIGVLYGWSNSLGLMQLPKRGDTRKG